MDYTIIGIHHGQKTGNQIPRETATDGVPPGKVFARVRMTVNGKLVDENFELDELPSVVPREIEEEIYKHMVKDKIEARIKELESKAKTSKVHSSEHDIDQEVHSV